MLKTICWPLSLPCLDLRFNNNTIPTKHQKTPARHRKLSRQHLSGKRILTRDILMCNCQNHVSAVGEGVESLGTRPRHSTKMVVWSLSLCDSSTMMCHNLRATRPCPHNSVTSATVQCNRFLILDR